MTAEPVRARLDADGRLTAADQRLDALNRRAGGAIGRPLAVPALAAAVRLALRLGVVVSRAADVADGDDTLSLWVRARPDAAGLSLELTGWTCPDDGQARRAAAARAEADWSFEIDAGLRIEAIGLPSAQALVGELLTRVVRLEEDGDGRLPMLEAAGRSLPFDAQPAILRDGGETLALSGTPRRGGGWIGTARRAGERAAPTPEDALAEALRRPLDRILRGAEDMSAERGSRYAGYAEDIAGAARHLLAIVEDLATLEEVEDDRLEPAAEALDLAAVARRAAGLVSIRAGEAGVRIEPPPAGLRLPARGEARRATQILVNLLGNAVRHSPSDGVVRITGGDDGREAVIVVADDGGGIAPADQARIFDRFERLGLRDAEGSGLGLYIARRYARSMGGDVTVASMPGSGARFALRLPKG